MLKKICITLLLMTSFVTAHAANAQSERPICPDEGAVRSSSLLGVDLAYDGLFQNDYITYSDYRRINGRPWMVIDGYVGAGNEVKALRKAKEDIAKHTHAPRHETAEQNLEWYYCVYYYHSGWFSDRAILTYSPRHYMNAAHDANQAVQAFKHMFQNHQ